MLPLNPSPVRARPRSPIRGAGPSPFAASAKGKGKVFGQDTPGVGPKQMFKDLMSRTGAGAGPSSKGLASQTPARRALGDKTNNASPGTRGPGADQDGASPSKKSPSKHASSSRLQSSPSKSRTQSPDKSQRHRQRQRDASPAKAAPTPAAADASYMTTATPAPAELGSRRTLSRVPSFVTPAQNIGKAGAIKARLGEMMDRMQGGDVDGEAETDEAEAGLTEEQLYPEIEYMAPSNWAKTPPYERPLELADVPTGAELGEALSSFRPAGFYRPRTSSHPDAPEHTLRGPSPDLFANDNTVDGLKDHDVDKIRDEERRELFGEEEIAEQPAAPSNRPASSASAISSIRGASVRPTSSGASTRPASSASSVRPKAATASSRTPLARLALGSTAARTVNKTPSIPTRPSSSASSAVASKVTSTKSAMPPPSRRPLATKSANLAKPRSRKPIANDQPDKLDKWLQQKEHDLAHSLAADVGVGLDIDEDLAGL